MPIARRHVLTALPQALTLLLILLSIPAFAAAQTSDAKHWGVRASFVPTWTGNDSLQKNFMGLEWAPPAEGSEWSVGFVRGTTFGGEWGLSYIKKPLKDAATTVTEGYDYGCNNNICTTATQAITTQLNDVFVQGIEYHVFLPFHTFARRVQVGLNIGAGAAFPEGTVTQSFTFTQTTTQPGKPPETFVETYEEELPVADAELIYPVVALLKIEFQTAFIVAPGLKVQIAAGMNTPSMFSFRIGAAYFFGGGN